MEIQCASCPKTFVPATSHQKYCGPTCRKRASRRFKNAGAGEVAAPSSPAPVSNDRPEFGPVLASTFRELSEAKRAESALGNAALALANRIDNSRTETGSALASLVNQHREAMRAALEGATKANDEIDELERRRREKLGALAR